LQTHSLDAGFGQFINILQWVCRERGVYFAKVDKNYTLQQCLECGTHNGKKDFSEHIYYCLVSFYTAVRDVAAACVIRNREVSGLGHNLEVKQIACGEDAAGLVATLI
jgi:putative transposase